MFKKVQTLNSKSKLIALMYLGQDRDRLEESLKEEKAKDEMWATRYDIRCIEETMKYLETY